MVTIDLADGKYTVINDCGVLSFKRYGAPWPVANADYAHSGLVLAMAHEIEILRDQVKQLRDHKSALEISVDGLRAALDGNRKLVADLSRDRAFYKDLAEEYTNQSLAQPKE